MNITDDQRYIRFNTKDRYFRKSKIMSENLKYEEGCLFSIKPRADLKAMAK